MAQSTGGPVFDIVLSLDNPPPGITATFTPPTVLANETFTLAISAASNAGLLQNTDVTMTGTPLASASPLHEHLLLTVTQPPGQRPDNRSDYVNTEGTPYSAVYDPVHNLIFASNPAWNRVDVISNLTHKISGSIPIRDPRGLDITPDSSSVWVLTGSQVAYRIDTSTFAASRFLLADLPPDSGPGGGAWIGQSPFALADGTVLLDVQQVGSTLPVLVIWDPVANSLTALKTPNSGTIETAVKSGDGKSVLIDSMVTDLTGYAYDVFGRQLTAVCQNCSFLAANFDGSRFVALDSGGNELYDSPFHALGPIPGANVNEPAIFAGGFVFSADGQFLYQISYPLDIPVLWTFDATTGKVVRVAPAIALTPVASEIAPIPGFLALPFAADGTGTVLGIQYYGISFDDSTFGQNFVTSQPGMPTLLQHMSPYSGPLAGGTVSSGFGNAFFDAPDVWYGQNRGTSQLDSINLLSITSPASATPGPINLKFLLADGVQVFDPLFFSYGPYFQNVIFNGAGPQGGAPGKITGFGLKSSGGNVTFSLGGSSAPLTSTGFPKSQYSYPFPVNTAGFTVPPGSPGWQDVTANTPDGQFTLSKSFLYAQSVSDFSSPDTFAAILYDRGRNQLYLSARDHIDVFSLASNTFLTPLVPPAQGTSKQFAGLALTADGTWLLAADINDGSLAAIEPDAPNSTFLIPVVAPVTSQNCTQGPMYVATSSTNLAFVISGGLPAIGCGPGGGLYRVDLSARTSALLSDPNPQCGAGGSSVGSSTDHKKVVFGGGGGICVYDAVTQTYSGNKSFFPSAGATISGDANALASQWVLLDDIPRIIGRVARPDLYFGDYGYDPASSFYLLLQPQLNDSGSLYFLPYPDFFDVVDMQHGTVRLRFSLTETISNVAAPIAIDSGGRLIFLLTNAGLTIIDLGRALLSIGSVTPKTASSGAQVILRGSGFDASMTATVGGQPAILNFIDENTAALTVPTGGHGPLAIVLKGSDGTTYTLENGIVLP